MLEVVVIGAGHAGLAVSHHLTARGVGHVVLERDRVGETWRRQRWDSFALNTPRSFSLLPADDGLAAPPTPFWLRDEVVGYLESYARNRDLPVRTGVNVTRVERGTGGFTVHADTSDPIDVRAVVVATGAQNVAKIPDFAAALPPGVTQLHSSAYRSPASLPPGAVLVVGAAQSGVQIAEDLLDAGRTVYLATGRVPRFRRRYRGRDCFDWLGPAGFFDQTIAQLPDPAMAAWPQPQISGTGEQGHSVSLQWLEGRGVRLLGHADGVADGQLTLRDDLGANIAFADRTSVMVSQQIDRAIEARGLAAGPVEEDPADQPHPDPASVHSPTTLDLEASGISTVVWSTGVTGRFSFLPTEALDASGQPLHGDGISPLPGLYLVGLPWLRTRSSGIIRGADADAGFIVGRIVAELVAA